MSSRQIVDASGPRQSMKYYAEYLSNIKSVGVYFEAAPGEASASTIATEEGGSAATLTYKEHGSKTISLPAATHEATAPLAPGATSVKLPVAQPLDIPEPGRSIPPNCICGRALTGPAVKWKRLPSEHWAELMDLWHCHKPRESPSGANTLYDLAMNGFHARAGQAYFSDTYLLVHQADIVQTVHADECRIAANARQAGDAQESIKLWRWDLDSGPVSGVVAEILAELIDAHAVYTYEVNEELLIWVFNPSVVYTMTDASVPARGCKVFYGPASELRQQRPDTEAVDLPAPIYAKFAHELGASNAKLPRRLQIMGKWRLAVL